LETSFSPRLSPPWIQWQCWPLLKK
jgi:hypothetical protein